MRNFPLNETALRSAFMFDVIIVGGGPAGLNAALILGRCRRRVLLCDSGRPRNWASRAIGGFLSRDGCPPDTLRRIAREQLAPYPDVRVKDIEVVAAERRETGFHVLLAGGAAVSARKLLLATGVVDDLPPLPGAEAFYGRGVHHCPYCDGWELRDAPLAAYGKGSEGKGLALELLVWSRDVVLCSDGPAELSDEDRRSLSRNGVQVREERVALLEGDGALERIRFADGSVLPRRGLFFCSCGRQAADFAERLGCRLSGSGSVETGRHERTEVPGLFVAGDASRNVQLAIIAAAEGAMAAFAINTELLKEDLRKAEEPAEAAE